jgi:hypothetical protein
VVSESNKPLTQEMSPIESLDDTVHQRVRLGILTIANESRPRTWISITKVGKGALRQEMAVLKALVRRVESAGGRTT